MRYADLVEYYQRLEATTKKLEKRDILAELYGQCSEKYLSRVVLLSSGTVFIAGEQELGIARKMMRRVIVKTYGVSENDVIKKFKETGDLGSTAEFFSKNRKQHSLAKRELTVEHVFENMRKLPDITGAGSHERKIALVNELLSHASPLGARYIVRTILGDMRIGVAAGIVRDAVAKAFGKDAKEIEHAYDIIGDYGQIAGMARLGKLKAEIRPGRPIRVMLADRAPDLKTALEKFENPALEYKYDGFRVAIHKDGNDVKIFSRRLEDVTHQFPDIAERSRENIKARQCIIEGESLAIGRDEKPLPFQMLSRRIQRKYDIERMTKEIPVQVNLFDVVYCNGQSLMNLPLSERWSKLKGIVRETAQLRLAEHMETKDFSRANVFYKRALSMGQEGVIVKNLDARYQPGRRVGFWLKVKEVLEPLDLVIVGAEWGEGKRTRYLGSFILAARSGDTFLETGRMASGLIEKAGDKEIPTMEEFTARLKKLIVAEEGKIVRVKPEIVVEVGYEELQKSPKYPTGYALRFPKILRLRPDRSAQDCATVQEINKLYKLQRGRFRKSA
ncbi:MAG: ATP-dependent DNA ligase [Candidatus Aenigmarchaeota archaeon]|nr:ATP-dependent DNA ligase [Candidatus Aenigmarchaeota archaeon]